MKIKLAVLVVFVFAGAFYFGGDREIVSGQTKIKQIQIEEIAGYKNWTKVNPTPQLMPERVASACFLWRSPDGTIVDGEANPHRDHYLNVYVNEIGRKAMMEKKNPIFPKGSVIVKEKFPDRAVSAPELLTVMIKQEKGFNPESGDWEYMAVDGTGTKLEGRGKLQNCQSCHLAIKENDYIFRTYLSEKTKKRLK